MADNQTLLDILLGKKPAKKPEPTPVEKARAKAYAPSQIVKVIAKNEAKKKADAESAYNAELKRKRTAVKQVPVDTKYGRARVPQAGYEAMSPEEQKAWLDATRKEIEATVDAQQKKDGGVIAQPTFNPYDSRPVTEKDAYVDMTNAYLGVQPVMGAVNAVAKTDTGKAIAGGAKGLSKSMTIKSDNPADQFVLDVTANAPAQFVESFGNIFDTNVDNIGKMQSMGEVYGTVAPVGQSVKAGKAVFDASRKAGVPLMKALAKGVGKAAVENFDIGLGAIKGGAKTLSDTLVRTGNRVTDALNVPQGIRERLITRTNQLPFTPKPALLERNPVMPGQSVAPPVVQPSVVKATESFENQQMAAIRDVMGADEVSGAVRNPDGTVNSAAPKDVPVIEPTPVVKENLTTPNGSKIEPEQPLQPQPSAEVKPTAPKMADMVPNEHVVAPAKDRPVTGISNAANLSDFDQGILSRAPEGKGRSVKEIIETNKDRKDWDDVADRINKGESYTADTAATVLLGKADYTANVKSAKEAIERGIVEGASEDVMRGLRNSLDDAIENATNYAEKVQRGSSDWSDVGRTLATMLNYNTHEIESVLQEARILKGSKLTREEIDLHTAQVKELTDLLESSKAEIARLMREHAENSTKVAAARKIVKTPEARAAKRKQALDEFMAASSGLNAYVNPAVLKQFAKYMYTLIEDGARSVDDIITAAAKDGVKADYEDVYAAMRTRVKESTLSDLQKEIAKTKRELMAAAKVTEGDEAVKAFRKNQKADAPGNESVKEFKLRELSKKRLDEKLKGLEERIANKDYAEVSIVKNARRTDDELDKLRQKIRVKEQIVKAGVESMRPRTGADKVGNYLNEIKLWNAMSRVKDFTANAVRGVDFAVSSLPRRVVDLATSKSLGEIPITKGTNTDRTARVFNKSKNRLKADAELILKGADPDSVKKYGSMGIGGKAAGLADVPFKSFYYEWMADAAADVKARKKLGKGASPEAIATEREAILADLDEHPDIQLMAEEYSLNQTLNNGNWASETVGFWRKKAGNTGAIAVDEFIGRFAKVITNVAIDATDRAGVGVIRGGLKIRNAKKLGKTLTTSERAIINDMITKGFTGLASVTLGYYMGDKVVGTIKGERSKYIDFGDAESIGGPMSAFLLGATIRKAESIEDPNEAMGLRMRTAMALPMNTPLASNAKDVLELLSEADEKTVSKYVARKAVGLIPIASQSRDIAERMDTKYGIKTGAEVEREKVGKEINPKTKKERQTSNFLRILKRDVQSKTPFWRQQLPVKQTAESKKKAKEAAEAKKVQWLR